ncbi:DUF1707 domain-containing protein [Actinoplanes sp. NPDC049548]|uniref:DUF1707 SHOCT-like domain-containing protein n=1 Tax=Actinoplanes sp. NPDC049548 TaxID=3155152 RepID=UPI0034241173
MGRDEMRAADADRQAVADQLRVALEEGRLELHEYDERLQRAYAAKTYGDLAGLLTDLPAATVPAPRPAPDAALLVTASDGELTRRWLAEVWGSWVSVVGITVAIWAVTCLATGGLTYFWPVWVAGPWGLVLVFATVSGLVGGEPRKRAVRRARKEQAKQLKRERRALEAEAISRGELPAAPKKAKEPKKTR